MKNVDETMTMKYEKSTECRKVIETMKLVTDQINNFISSLDHATTNSFVEALLESNRIFIMGSGRSGLVARAFAMRLMHLGLTVYVIGETTTPSVSEDDMVVAISGSGETNAIVSLGKVAKEKIGCRLATVTSNPDSTMGRLSDIIIKVPGRAQDEKQMQGYLERHMLGEYLQLMPLGTAFEINSLVYLDAVIAELMYRMGVSDADMRKRHATIE